MNQRQIAVHQALILGHQAQLNLQLAAYHYHRQRRRAVKRVWVYGWMSVERRLERGFYDGLMEELRLEDPHRFTNFVRMEPRMFDEILNRVRVELSKQDTNFRKAIDPGLKLACTLRYLATGESYTSLQYQFRVSQPSISHFLPLVIVAIKEAYRDEVMECPTTVEGWRAVAREFDSRWNVPHACGALDGKHISIRQPPESGSEYHNYKGFFSLVMLALVDAQYKFLWVDIGGQGSQSDCQIFNSSELKEALEDGSLNLPPADAMPNDDQPTPYFILGDDAFALKSYLMKPYPYRGMTREQRIYNYRISRGRRVVENAFGILAQRFNVLLSTMLVSVEHAKLVVEGCVILHNLMRMRYPNMQNPLFDREDQDHNIIPGQWRVNANRHEIQQVHGHNIDSTVGKRQRETLRLYFNSPAGSVPWQHRMV